MHIHIIMSARKIYSVVKGLYNVINNETWAVSRAPCSILYHILAESGKSPLPCELHAVGITEVQPFPKGWVLWHGVWFSSHRLQFSRSLLWKFPVEWKTVWNVLLMLMWSVIGSNQWIGRWERHVNKFETKIIWLCIIKKQANMQQYNMRKFHFEFLTTNLSHIPPMIYIIAESLWWLDGIIALHYTMDNQSK